MEDLYKELLDYLSMSKKDDNKNLDDAYARSVLSTPDASNLYEKEKDMQNAQNIGRMLYSGNRSTMPILMPGGYELKRDNQLEFLRQKDREDRIQKQNEALSGILYKNKENQDKNFKNALEMDNASTNNQLEQFQKIDNAMKMINYIKESKTKRDMQDPNSEINKLKQNETLQRMMSMKSNLKGTTYEPLISFSDDLSARAEWLKNNPLNSAQLESFNKNLEEQRDNAYNIAKLDVDKELGKTRNSISITGLNNAKENNDENRRLKEQLEEQKLAKSKTDDASKHPQEKMHIKNLLSAENDIDDAIRSGGDPSSLSAVIAGKPLIGSLASKENQQLVKALTRWGLSQQYLESGKAVTEQEGLRAALAFFPGLNAPKEVVDSQKKARMDLAENAADSYGMKEYLENYKKSKQQSRTYTPQQEAGIKAVMDAKKISREDAIKALKSSGRL